MQDLFNYFEQFQTLSEVDKHAINECCSLRKVSKLEIIETAGSISKTLYFLKIGIARTYYYKDGTDVTEYFALAGNLITRVESLLTKKSSLKAIQMIESGELIAINYAKFFELFDTFPHIERLYRLVLESAYIDIVERLESLQFHSAKERYAAIINHSELIQKIPLKYIASYLGITSVSLSRIRANYISNVSKGG